MEEDEVGFDVEVAEAAEEFFVVGEEVGVEAGGVVEALRMLFADGGGAGEDVELGLVVVVLVVLGEDAHADLVEGRGGEGLEGLGFELRRPDGPRRSRWFRRGSRVSRRRS